MRSSTSAAGERAAQLTHHLLAFSRGEAVSPELLELNRVTTHMAKILGRLIGEHIEIDLKLGTKLGLVCMDPGHLEQVLLNLAVNARGAMPNGGRLTIETRPVLLDDSTSWPTTRRSSPAPR